MATAREIDATIALEANFEQLCRLPNAIGWATGLRQRSGEWTDEVVVQVFVTRKVRERDLAADALCPPRLHVPNTRAIRTDVIEVGTMEPFQDTTTYRPVRGGCSMGNLTRVNAGTLGGFVCDERDDSVVWLTNNHVVTATNNRMAVPADARVVQPGQLDGGSAPADVIGRTRRVTPIATGPTRATAPVNALDAAIGSVSVDYEVNVIDVAPAPFELGAPAQEMTVLKRGRTTGLTTNGTVVSTNAAWTLNYGTALAPTWGTVGSGGSVFNIAAPSGQIFADRGDSGSLIFDQTEGDIRGTLPCVGLLFAGGGSPFGNLIGACNINTVFASMDLTTVCTCVIRAIIEAIFGRSGTRAEARSIEVSHAEHRLRRFRSRVLDASRTGRAVSEFVTRNAPHLTNALLADDETFGLAVRTLEPWVLASTSLEVLDRPIDAATIEAGTALARRVVRQCPELGEIEPLAQLLKEAEGKPVRTLLGYRSRVQRLRHC